MRRRKRRWQPSSLAITVSRRSSAEEIGLIWPLLRMRLAVSVVNSTIEAKGRPNDPYVTISQAPAWRLLENSAIDGELMGARLRNACGLPVTDAAGRIASWIAGQRGSFAPVLGRALDGLPVGSLGVAEATIPANPFELRADEARHLGTGLGITQEWWLGQYGEPRLVYTDKAFRKGRWLASNRRTIHMAVDVFGPAGEPVRAPLAGKVALAENRKGHLDYGGVVILEHRTPEGDVFHTLYGHLSADGRSQAEARPGDRQAKLSPCSARPRRTALGAASAFPARVDAGRHGP